MTFAALHVIGWLLIFVAVGLLWGWAIAAFAFGAFLVIGATQAQKGPKQ